MTLKSIYTTEKSAKRNEKSAKPCKTLNIGTSNVRSMMKKEKLENVKIEMERNGLNVLGLGEVRWKDSGDYWSDKYRVIYSGGKKSGERGVAIVLDEETGKRVKKVVEHSDRVIVVKMEAEPRDIVAVQVYMPTSSSEDEKVDEVYEQRNDIIEAEKGNDYLILMGDWNAVIGEGEQGYGHGRRLMKEEKN